VVVGDATAFAENGAEAASGAMESYGERGGGAP
jgi:hypothetical protein